MNDYFSSIITLPPLLVGRHLLYCPHRILTGPRGLSLARESDRVQSRLCSVYTLEVKVSSQPLMSLVLKGIALAMGAAAAVISILGTGSPDTLITLLGIGLFCLAIWALQKGQ